MKHFTLVAAATLFAFTSSAQINDGGFEGGAGGGAWTEASTNFGTPLCDAGCGTCGGPCVSRTGAWYVWFGGAGGVTETGSVEQSAMVPTGPDVRLIMYVKVALPNAEPNDRVDVSVDGTVVASVSVADSSTYGDYTLLDIDMNSYAGGTHTIRIEGFQTTTTVSNILVDDVALLADGSTVGLFENEALPGIMVYPNPANDIINLSFNALEGEAVITLIDMSGKIVATERVAEVSRRIFSYDARDLDNGAYMVSVRMANKQYSERVLIAR